MSPLPFRLRRRGAILVIVLWICLGIVALTLYFANSMSAELRAADNRATEIEARLAVAGGARYAAQVLATYAVDGAVPELNSANPDCPYEAENLRIGDAAFWLIGRDPNLPATATDPVFGLVDESSKLNLNTANAAMLSALPNMTPELATAILAWRSRNAATGAAASNAYAALNPPRLNKGAPFESVDELRLVYGVSLDLLLGEDLNRNGALDDNEDDGEGSPPRDIADGVLQAGFLEYVTVYSAVPNVRADGTRRVNITTPQARGQLLNVLVRQLGDRNRATAIIGALGTRNFDSVAALYAGSGMTPEEFAKIQGYVTATDGARTQGLVNVNTAPAAVLACIPGMNTGIAPQVVAYRAAHPEALTSFVWLRSVIGLAAFERAGPYITGQSYQFSADIAAVGRNGRGYCRERFVFDTSQGTPRIVNRQDLGSAGWALGSSVRAALRSDTNSLSAQ